jgi:hypothetical protein
MCLYLCEERYSFIDCGVLEMGIKDWCCALTENVACGEISEWVALA